MQIQLMLFSHHLLIHVDNMEEDTGPRQTPLLSKVVLNVADKLGGKSSVGFLITAWVGAGLTAIIYIFALWYLKATSCVLSKPGVKPWYDGCFDWNLWLVSMAALIAGSFFTAFCFYITSASARIVQARRRPSLGFLSLLGLGIKLFALSILAWTYAILPSTLGYNIPGSGGKTPYPTNPTLQTWIVFMGALMFSITMPFFVAVLSVLNRLRKPVDRGGLRREESLIEKAESERNEALHALPRALLLLLFCWLLTLVGAPLWNQPLNTYLKKPSAFSMFFLPLGGPRACSVGPNATCGCDDRR
jgi:hypothetical protein